ncbi:MAG: Dihydrolipoyl dehydrogenase [Chlamydiia bacterium]|nr:Dihydrolipoyl dehydrogenase [Chlamydiia bacterium]
MFDVVVVGGGPGGYVAAIRAAGHGLKVGLIEKEFERLGGTCLNVGCIPTKTLVASAETMKTVESALSFGIEAGSPKVHFDKVKARKDRVVSEIRTSLEGLIKSHQVEIIYGTASFVSDRELFVKGPNRKVEAKAIIIATGSRVKPLRGVEVDGEKVHNSDTILELERQPQSISIVGGGYIGCEFAGIFNALGTKVTVVEFLPAIVQAQGKSMSEFLTKKFTDDGIDVMTGVGVEGVDTSGSGCKVQLNNGEMLETDLVLVSVGRDPVTDGLELHKAGLGTNEWGFIEVDANMETSTGGIYAIGDVNGRSMLAHSASFQGELAADRIAGKEGFLDESTVPAVIFTIPEMASVGLTHEQAIEAGHKVNVGKFPMSALGKAKGAGHEEGFVEVIAEASTGEIVGCQIVGHHASDIIAEVALAKTNELTLDCIGHTIHAHPTMAESILEACNIAAGCPVHFPPSKKKKG